MRLVKNDEAFLRQVSKEVSNARGLRLGKDMHTFLLRFNKTSKVKGVGLAAIQVAVPEQVCIIQLNNLKLTLVNPKIVEHSSVQIEQKEGCLSFPNKEVTTYRWPWIKVWTANLGTITLGKKLLTDSSDKILEAVVAQHELDHLMGIVFFDRTEDLTEKYQGFRLGISNPNPGE